MQNKYGYALYLYLVHKLALVSIKAYSTDYFIAGTTKKECLIITISEKVGKCYEVS